MWKGFKLAVNSTIGDYKEYWINVVKTICSLILIILAICLSIFNPYFKDLFWNYPEESYRELENEAESFVKELEKVEFSDSFDEKTKKFSTSTLSRTISVTVRVTEEETNITRNLPSAGWYYFFAIFVLLVSIYFFTFCIANFIYIPLFFVAIIKWIIWMTKTIQAYRFEKNKTK